MVVRQLQWILSLLILPYGSDQLYNQGGEMPTEAPLPFPVPLPSECVIPNIKARSYNQGQCSRKPCQTKTGPCSLFWRCCYEVGQTSSVPLSCSNSKEPLLGSVVITCECQPCEKLHAYIRGRVFSSHAHHPVILAAILLGTEIIAFTDKNGKFFFELATVEGEVNLLFQEVHHRQVEVVINLRATLTPDVVITMEYIDNVMVVEKMQQGFHMELGSMDTAEVTGIKAFLSVPAHSLLGAKSYEAYQGPGHVLYSLYHMDSRPEFTSAAVQSMVYRDSRGIDFSIQSHVSGSLRVVGETGEPLSFKQGYSAKINVTVRFDTVIEVSQIEGLHIFTYPDSSSHWMDNGKVTLDLVQQSQYSTLVALSAKLRDSNLLWAVGFPARITCYIKSKVSHLLTHQEQVGVSVQLEQSMINLDRPSFYLASEKSFPGEGVCLQAVCSLGGLLYVMDTAVGEEVYTLALTPSTDHGVIMGNHNQVMFYNVEKSLVTSDATTPYYPTQEACVTSEDNKSGRFEFLVNISLPKSSRVPSVLPPVPSEPLPHTHNTEYCCIKVGVYDCSQQTSIQVLSFSSRNHSHFLSMSTEVLTPGDRKEGHRDAEKCLESNVMHLRVACLEYSCGSDVHVSATTWSPGNSATSSSKEYLERRCRYWSSHSSLTEHMHLGDNMTSFHVADGGAMPRGGLYRALSKDLVLFQCNAEKTVDHQSGLAVTLICL